MSFDEIKEILAAGFGAVGGGGVVWGRMTQKIAGLEHKVDGVQVAMEHERKSRVEFERTSDVKREALLGAMHDLRAEVLASVRSLGDELKRDVREVRGAMIRQRPLDNDGL